MKFVWAVGTHPGRTRVKNEDVVHPDHDGYGYGPLLVGVADGMGGHAAGEVASRVAMDHAVAAGGSLDHRVRAANEAIFAAVRRRPKLEGMGTTLTLAEVLPDGTVTLGHVGDSRAYRLRDGRLARITVDHTYVQRLVTAGQLSEERARTHRRRSLLDRVLGFFRWDLEVDIEHTRLSVGDRLLLCSDGLTEMVAEDEIAAILEAGPPSDAVWGLIEAANRAGGRDNISVVVVLAEPHGQPGGGAHDRNRA